MSSPSTPTTSKTTMANANRSQQSLSVSLASTSGDSNHQQMTLSFSTTSAETPRNGTNATAGHSNGIAITPGSSNNAASKSDDDSKPPAKATSKNDSKPPAKATSKTEIVSSTLAATIPAKMDESDDDSTVGSDDSVALFDKLYDKGYDVTSPDAAKNPKFSSFFVKKARQERAAKRRACGSALGQPPNKKFKNGGNKKARKPQPVPKDLDEAKVMLKKKNAYISGQATQIKALNHALFLVKRLVVKAALMPRAEEEDIGKSLFCEFRSELTYQEADVLDPEAVGHVRPTIEHLCSFNATIEKLEEEYQTIKGAMDKANKK